MGRNKNKNRKGVTTIDIHQQQFVSKGQEHLMLMLQANVKQGSGISMMKSHIASLGELTN